MAQKRLEPGQSAGGSKKRREPPTESKQDNRKRPKTDHRTKRRDARSLSTQTASKAFKNGEMDVDKFVKSREYEIRALEEGMARSKKALTTRAFQHVPKDLRRRTASHNAKRVPKRLQPRAKREMVEDNTPTVTAKKRKPTKHMRLRVETAKHLRAIGARKKSAEGKTSKSSRAAALVNVPPISWSGIKARQPKVKKSAPAAPPIAKAKFRKRQIHKTWLPTHMFHAKRARMTAPKEPLWRFSIPLTPTAKSYRPTHRAANARGAVAWDTSYVSTIGIEGRERSIAGVFKALGVGVSHTGIWSSSGRKWRSGTRVWEGLLFERDAPHKTMAPATIIWNAVSPKPDKKTPEPDQRQRRVFVRVHPSAFWQIWEELVRLAKIAKPQVSVHDLRFEIGSVEITGPASNEALHGALWSSAQQSSSPTNVHESVESLWASIGAFPDPALLPPDMLLGFEVTDPRLHFTPRKSAQTILERDQEKLFELLASWPADSTQASAAIFDRRARLAASSALPSQKAINRRKALAAPGDFPEPSPKDPSIPVLLYRCCQPKGSKTSFTLLLPWKCVQPVWYSIMYCPLSTGMQPKFAGLDEQRQLLFENGQPWFPADFPGTKSGWQWEVEQRVKRKDEWDRRPKSKRTNWAAVNLGTQRKGEVGTGWACSWEGLLPRDSNTESGVADELVSDQKVRTGSSMSNPEERRKTPEQLPVALSQVSGLEAERILCDQDHVARDDVNVHALAIVRISLLVRGVPQTCARIYRLPSSPESAVLRRRWLALHPKHRHEMKQRGSRHGVPQSSRDAPAELVQRRLAQSLLEPPQVGDGDYPTCPEEEDLIGFVTTGDYNLGEGQGTAIGSIVLSKVVAGVHEDEKSGRLCIVRNSGNEVGRLAVWEIAKP